MPTNNYYNHGSVPQNGTPGDAQEVGAEFDSVQAGFAKMAALSGNGGKLVGVNAGGTAQEAVAADGVISAAIHAATAKTTPVDADEIGYWDSVSAAFRNMSVANFKATFKTYFDGLYAALTGSASQTFSVSAATSAVHAPSASQIQNQSLTAFTTAGTSTAYTLTTTLATALTTNERFQITPHIASGANPTLNRDAKGAKSIKMYSRNSATLKVPAILYAGRAYDIFYDGVDYVVVDADKFGIVAHFQYDGNAQAIRGSGGIASITRTGVGAYVVAFADAMPDANYTFVGSTNEDAGVAHFGNPTNPTTSGFTFRTYNNVGVAADCTYICGAVII